MQLAHYHLTAAIGGLVAILIMGCNDATGPGSSTTGAILVTVSTEGTGANLPGGYSLVIDLGPAQAITARDY
jgi:hypothetical protein